MYVDHLKRLIDELEQKIWRILSSMSLLLLFRGSTFAVTPVSEAACPEMVTARTDVYNPGYRSLFASLFTALPVCSLHYAL